MTSKKTASLMFLSFSLSIIASSYGWAQTSSLYLPLPAAVPATNVFLPIASSILLSLSVVLSRHRIRAIAALPTVLAYILTVVPIILLTISLAYCIPSSALACLTDTRWDRLFRSKNEGAISSIQGQLRCCGLNSMRDRAWPFERHGVSVRECEESQGWTRRCLDVWTSSEQQTAGLAVAASVLNWIFIVSFAIVMRRQHGKTPSTLPLSLNGNTAATTITASRGYGTNNNHSSEQPQAFTDAEDTTNTQDRNAVIPRAEVAA